jgi:hypothetical protein
MQQVKWTKQLDDQLRAMYHTHTRVQIAQALGLREAQVRSRFWTLGIAEKVKPWTDDEIAALRKAYSVAHVNELLDLDRLAKRFGRHKANVCRKARALGLTNIARRHAAQLKMTVYNVHASEDERRSAMSCRAKKMIAEKGHPRGALGMVHTDEAKATISAKARERWTSMTDEERADLVFKRVKARRDQGVPFANPRGNWKAGWREIGEKRNYFRSRWEANYARYLEWLRSIGQIADWEHEAKTFWFEGIKRGCVSYLPDFKVTNPSGSVEWHEVKGWMDARSKTTIERMGRYHPSEKLVVIREKQYEEIRRKVSSLIPGWEEK